MGRTVAILALVSGIAAAPAAWAQSGMLSPTWPPPPPERPAETPADDGNFGAQVLVADLAGLGATVALANRTGSWAALLPYLLAAPTVHALHEDAAGAAGSLLLNAGVPVAAAYVGWYIDSRHCGPDTDVCGAGGIALGFIAGVGTAFVVDAVLLSHPERSASKPKIQVTPTVDPDRMFSLMLSGRF